MRRSCRVVQCAAVIGCGLSPNPRLERPGGAAGAVAPTPAAAGCASACREAVCTEMVWEPAVVERLVTQPCVIHRYQSF